jgi:hypothetical protein
MAEHTVAIISWFLLVGGLPEHSSLLTDICPSLNCLNHSLSCAQPIFGQECPSFRQNLMQMCCSTFLVTISATLTTHTTTGFGWLPVTEQSEQEAIIHACAQRSEVTCNPLPAPSTLLFRGGNDWRLFDNTTYMSRKISLITAGIIWFPTYMETFRMI